MPPGWDRPREVPVLVNTGVNTAGVRRQGPCPTGLALFCSNGLLRQNSGCICILKNDYSNEDVYYFKFFPLCISIFFFFFFFGGGGGGAYHVDSLNL